MLSEERRLNQNQEQTETIISILLFTNIKKCGILEHV